MFPLPRPTQKSRFIHETSLEPVINSALSFITLTISFISDILPLCNYLKYMHFIFHIRVINFYESFKAPTSVFHTKMICLAPYNTYHQGSIHLFC